MICLLRRRERDERVRLRLGFLDAERSRSGTHHNLSLDRRSLYGGRLVASHPAPVQHTWQVEVEIKLLLEESSAGPRLHLDQDRAPLCRGARPTDVLVLVERHTALAHGYTLLFRDRFYARRHTAADDISSIATHVAQNLIGSTT
jgi:hypothetical protein